MAAGSNSLLEERFIWKKKGEKIFPGQSNKVL